MKVRNYKCSEVLYVDFYLIFLPTKLRRYVALILHSNLPYPQHPFLHSPDKLRIVELLIELNFEQLCSKWHAYFEKFMPIIVSYRDYKSVNNNLERTYTSC